MGRCFCAAIARTRSDRGSHHHDRVSLGGGTRRALRRDRGRIAPAFEALKGRADALYVCIDALVNAKRIRINTPALGVRLPTMHGSRDYVEAGGLMSYGPNYPDL